MDRALRTMAAAVARSVSGETPVPPRRTIAYSGGFLFLSGAVLVTIGLLVERSPGTRTLLALPAVLVATVVSILLLSRPELLPLPVYPLLTALGTALISVLAYSDGSLSSAESLLYVWVVLYSFYFYSLRIAVLETVVVAAAAAIELAFRRDVSGRLPLWLLITGTSLIGGLAIRQLVTQVRWLADRDGLTGLYNRRRMLEELERDRRRAERAGEPLSVVILDLDRFKQFNDDRGHLEGDRHLREVAECWAAELRSGDVLARFGGEEFVVVMPACPLEQAVVVADRLRTVTPNQQTASAGAVVWDANEDAMSLLGRADAALYVAKQTGRDRTVVGSGDRRSPAPRG